MSRNVLRLAFLNIGHAYDHLFMLLYATVVLALEDAFQMTYGELIALSFPDSWRLRWGRCRRAGSVTAGTEHI